MTINLYAGWMCLFLGCIAGIIPGLFFHDDDWLGGYSSWARRMIRLAHIAFFGIGLLNLSFVLTAQTMGVTSGLLMPAILLLVGALAMPLVCYLSAWRRAFRHVFFVPAMSVTLATALFLWGLLR